MKKIAIGVSGMVIAASAAIILFFTFSNSETNAAQQAEQNNVQLSPRGPADSTWLISEGHAGRIELNMEVSKLEKLFSKENITEKMVSSEGAEYKMFYIAIDGKQEALVIEPICTDICEVSRIFIHSEKYKTKEGIGIGNTVTELKTAYTVEKLTGNEDGGIYMYTDKFPQIAFEVKPAGLKIQPGKVYTIAEIPGNTTISSIYMY